MEYTGEIFNQTPLMINVDEWVSGKKQVLYITGLSGGGKGYHAKKYAEKRKGTVIIELDKFENYQWYIDKKEDNPNVANGDKIIFDYLKRNYRITKDLDIFDTSAARYKILLRYFYQYLREYMYEKNPETPFIIEGIQIFSDDPFKILTNEDSIMIIRTAMVRDMTKVMDRAHPVFRNRFHTFNDAQQKLKEFEERLNIPAMQAVEAAQIDPATGAFKTPQDLSEWMKANIQYADFSRLNDIVKTIQTRRGSCHEQSIFASFFLDRMGISNNIYFLIEANQDQGGMTHSFVVYKKNNRVYWFENAWKEFAGIHEFNSEKELFQHLRTLHKNGEFGNSAVYPKLHITYFVYRVGDTLQQLVNRTFRNK